MGAHAPTNSPPARLFLHVGISLASTYQEPYPFGAILRPLSIGNRGQHFASRGSGSGGGPVPNGGGSGRLPNGRRWSGSLLPRAG